MSIPYYLRENNLKKDQDEYRTGVVHRRYVPLERVINRMLYRELHEFYKSGMQTQKVEAKTNKPNIDTIRDIDSFDLY